MLFDPRLYVIIDASEKALAVAKQAIAGGVTAIQLRDKKATALHLVTFGQKLHALTREYNTPLFVNDRVDVAMAINAEGIHIGQDDMPLVFARKIIGSKKIIGVSVQTVEQARQAEQDGADYLGCGPVFPTMSKADASSPIGLTGLAAVAASVSVPVIAIGGIDHTNIRDVRGKGVAGVAVISAIMEASDPRKAATMLK